MCALFTEASLGSSHSDGDHGFPNRKRQKPALSTSEVVAGYFCKKLDNKEGIVHRTKVQKLTYFVNGLHYVLTDTPVIAEPFEAHRHGTFLRKVQNLLDNSLTESSRCGVSLKKQWEESEVIEEKRKLKGLLNTVFAIFGSCSSRELSDFTHEPMTPYSQVRPRWDEPLEMGQAAHDMNISQDLDRLYFSDPTNIKRFFLSPYIEGRVKRKESTVGVLSALLERYSPLFLSYLSWKLEDVKECIQSGDDVEEAVFGFLKTTRGIPLYDDLFRQYLRNVFAHSQQNAAEGALAEVLFDNDFVEQNEIQLFYDHSFRVRAALAAKLKNLSALYYLKRIFETFSDEEDDSADKYAKDVDSKLYVIIRNVTSSELPATPSWQVLYELALALFYHPTDSDTAVAFIDQALLLEMPARYKKDLLKRGFSLTGDQRYVDQGIRDGFKEFCMYKAASSPSLDEAFPIFEQGVMDEIPEAFFEAGKSILRSDYTVPVESGLWVKLGVSPVSAEGGEDVRTQNIALGEALLKRAVQLDVQAALSCFIDWCDDNLDKALEACDLVENKPWALYQIAKIKEKQYKLKEAIKAYKAAGPLIGYMDAARLEKEDKEARLLKEYKDEKNKTLKRLHKILE